MLNVILISVNNAITAAKNTIRKEIYRKYKKSTNCIYIAYSNTCETDNVPLLINHV